MMGRRPMSRQQREPLRSLQDTERVTLARLSRSASAPAEQVARARALLAVAEGGVDPVRWTVCRLGCCGILGHLGLVGDRRQIADPGMTTGRVVPALNEAEDGR